MPLKIGSNSLSGKVGGNSFSAYQGTALVTAGGGLTLGPLTVSPATATTGLSFTATVSGRTAGSTLSLAGTGSAGLSINNTTAVITGTPTTAGPIDVVETLVGASGSPRTSSGVVTVVAPIALPSISSMTAAFEPDYSGNVVDTLDVTFGPSDIDTVNGKTTLTGLKFNAFLSYNSASGTPVYFQLLSGTAPGGLVDGSSYYIVPAAGGGYELYPIANASNVANIPGHLTVETIFPAQNFAQKTNKVPLNSSGSGSFRLYSDKLVYSLVDRTGGGLTVDGRNGANDRNSHHQIKSDSYGQYIVSRILAREWGSNTSGSYAVFGKSPKAGGLSKSAAQAIVGGKRVFWSTFIARNTPTPPVGIIKNSVASTAINTTTGVITSNPANGKLATGDLVRIQIDPGGTVPAGWTVGADYYANVSGTQLKLYDSPTNATANTATGLQIPTTQGSGNITFYCPTRVADYHRQQFFMEWLEYNQVSSANTLSPEIQWSGPTGGGIIKASFFTTSGGTNGDILNIKGFASGGPAKISVKWAAGATPPTCQDTGLPLADGDYWVTQYTGSNQYGRLHRTQSAAQAAVGVATSALNNTQMIKFSAAGVGEALFNWNDGTTPWNYNATQQGSGGGYGQTSGGSAINFTDRISFGDGNPHVYTFLVDLNDPAQTTPIGKTYIDGVLWKTHTLDGVKGLSGTTGGAATLDAFTMFNSAASHVTFEGDFYGMYMGATTAAVPDSDILSLHTYCKSKIGVP